MFLYNVMKYPSRFFIFLFDIHLSPQICQPNFIITLNGVGSFKILAVAASEEVERRVFYYCCHRHVFGEHVAVAYAYLVGKLALRALERVEHLLLVVVSRQLLERVCQLVPQQQHVVPTAEWHVRT